MFPTSKLAVLQATLLVSICFFVAGERTRAEPKLAEVPITAIYHPDREHLWNRIHAAFQIRIGPDGRSYGEDRLEPLLWYRSKYLLEGMPAERAEAVLEEFLRDKGESLIDDPIKRAVLQRDLWLVSNWLSSKHNNEARKRLEPLLTKVIRKLALTAQQIAKLPDNYAASVASKKYASAFDSTKPERSYLPADLFQPDGPWVSVGRTDGPTAPSHIRGDTNSKFLIFLKLPGGRDKTLEFLKALAAFDKLPMLPNDDVRTQRSFAHLPNPALPQWPKGTEVALVRRALLIDSSGNIVASPLTESVQLRAMSTDAPALTAEAIDKMAARTGTGGQLFAKFQLRRTELFGGKAGGLRDVSDERDFETGFNTHGFDEFEQPPSNDRPFPERAYHFANNRASCVACHSAPGVYGFNSPPFFAFGLPSRFDFDAKDWGRLKSALLAEMKPDAVEKAAIMWKEQQPGWITLRELLSE